MTYRDLIERIKPEDMDLTVTVYDGLAGEYHGITTVERSSFLTNDVLDDGHPYLYFE